MHKIAAKSECSTIQTGKKHKNPVTFAITSKRKQEMGMPDNSFFFQKRQETNLATTSKRTLKKKGPTVKI